MRKSVWVGVSLMALLGGCASTVSYTHLIGLQQAEQLPVDGV